MQILTVKIEDNIVQEFFDFVNKYKNDIHVTQDRNLELDAYLTKISHRNNISVENIIN